MESDVNDKSADQRREIRRLHFLAIAIGIWLVVAPFVLNYGDAAVTWNEVIAGLLTAGLGAWRLYRPRLHWTSWALGAWGVWFVLSPFLFGYGRGVAAYWNELGMGVFLVILAFAAVGNAIREHSHLAH